MTQKRVQSSGRRRGERGASLVLLGRTQRPGTFRPLGPLRLQLCISIHNSDYIYITPALVFVSLYQIDFTSINWF